jgi:hypothetical protein
MTILLNPKYRRSFFITLFSALFAIIATSSLLAAPAPAHNGQPSDSYIHYIGRWDKSNPASYVGYWNTPYLIAGFTGTSITVNLAKPAIVLLSIDDNPYTRLKLNAGISSLTPAPLAPGKHIILLGSEVDFDFAFKGLNLDAGAHTYATEETPIIEYIGDSLSCGGFSNYTWIASDDLGYEHVQIASPRIALSTGWSFTLPRKFGMDQEYPLLKGPRHYGEIYQPLWHFTYKPKLVVINLGQVEPVEPTADFAANYLKFVKMLRSKYATPIVLVNPFSGNQSDGVKLAYQEMVAAKIKNVHFVDTTGWIQSSDTRDGVEPNSYGTEKIAKLLEAKLAPLLK